MLVNYSKCSSKSDCQISEMEIEASVVINFSSINVSSDEFFLVWLGIGQNVILLVAYVSMAFHFSWRCNVSNVSFLFGIESKLVLFRHFSDLNIFFKRIRWEDRKRKIHQWWSYFVCSSRLLKIQFQLYKDET